MARSPGNILTDAARGKIGDVVVKHYAYGQVLARPPRKSIVPPSEKQLFNQERWQAAAVYYWKVKSDPLLFTAYSAVLPKMKKKGYPLNALTNRDFFNPPKVSAIDLRDYDGKADQLIRIEAHDDFAVASVDVTLCDAAGNAIESGPAWKDLVRWHYRTKTIAPLGPVKFEVVAKDLPGNTGTRSATWTPRGYAPPEEAAPTAVPASAAQTPPAAAPAVFDFDPRAE